MLELVAIPFSPWSEKARWALDHHRLSYREHRYQSPIEEPWLRLRLRKFRGKVSVPVLFDDVRGQAYCDSFDIARHADAIGGGAPLMAAPDFERVRAFDLLSERGLAAARPLALARVLSDEASLDELVPKAVRRSAPKLGRALARQGIERVLRKYRRFPTPADAERELRTALEELTAGLDAASTLHPKADGEGPVTLLPQFSFADIAAAQLIQFVVPVTSPTFRIGRATRQTFGSEALAKEFASLVRWRDDLYTTYRQPVSAGSDSRAH